MEYFVKLIIGSVICEFSLLHLSFETELGSWSNWTECTEDIVCNGDGKQSRYRLCEHDVCLENGTLYMRGTNQTESRDCNFTCASKIVIFLVYLEMLFKY